MGLALCANLLPTLFAALLCSVTVAYYKPLRFADISSVVLLLGCGPCYL